MKALTTVGVVAGVVVVGYLGFQSLQTRASKSEVNVTLSTTADGGCAPAISDVAGGGWLTHVTWHIANNCANAQVVTMRDFVKDASGAKSTDKVKVFSDDPIVSGQIAARDPDYRLKERITKLVLLTSLYHYTICSADQTNGIT